MINVNYQRLWSLISVLVGCKPDQCIKRQHVWYFFWIYESKIDLVIKLMFQKLSKAFRLIQGVNSFQIKSNQKATSKIQTYNIYIFISSQSTNPIRTCISKWCSRLSSWRMHIRTCFSKWNRSSLSKYSRGHKNLILKVNQQLENVCWWQN